MGIEPWPVSAAPPASTSAPFDERTGGHAYGSVYPGPIGAVLTPQLAAWNMPLHSLRLASRRCLLRRLPGPDRHPADLVHVRAKAVEGKRRSGVLPTSGALVVKTAAVVLSFPVRLAAVRRLAAPVGRILGRGGRVRRLPGPSAAGR